VANDRHLEARSVPDRVCHQAQNFSLRGAPDERRDRVPVCAEAHRVFRRCEHFARRVVVLRTRPLDDERDLARVRPPQRRGDALVHCHRVRFGSHNLGQARPDVEKARRHVLLVAQQVVDRDGAEAPGGVREKALQANGFAEIHVR
jgi:hypothetical protein